ncbi:MAG: hypothetical protein WD335_01180 [Candidatus Paceibacterota bacterium]
MPKTKNNRLDKLENEVNSLRREVDMFIPTETLDEYDNAEDIESAYQDATSDHSVDD